MITRQMRVLIQAHDHGDWCVSVIQDTFERGRRVGSDMIHNTWCDTARLHKFVSQALDTVVALEAGRIRKVDATGRSMPLERP